MNGRVSAIVPAYNEESTVGTVVRVLRASPLLDEVVVVCDGSADRTAEVASEAGATVYALPENAGKGAALLHGVSHVDAPVLAFFDADLIGLTPDHVERLVLPVLSGSRAMNVGMRDRGPFFNRVIPYLPLVSGERALRREVIEGVPPEFLQGYMVETALNYFCRVRGLPYGSVPLSGLTIRRKPEKVGWRRGVVQYVRMAWEIIQATAAVRMARFLRRF